MTVSCKELNKLIKKILSAALAALLILSALTSCQSSAEKKREEALKELYQDKNITIRDEETVTSEEKKDVIPTAFALPYSGDDVFNPYTCTTTINNTICDLLFDRLVTIDDSYSLSYSMAKSVTVKDDTVTVELLPGLLFSDGSAVTVYDIVYSCNMARISEGSHYKKQLETITEVTHKNNKIYFKLNQPDVMAGYLLDFPIIKRNSDQVYGVTPIGSGRYKFASDPTSGTSLSINSNWHGYSTLSISQILLLKMPSLESIIYSVEIGTLGFFYSDLTSNDFTNINAVTNLVDLNNLVYLGVNTNNKILAKDHVRQAINLGINREDISVKSYTGRALPALGPFTSNWKNANEFQTGSEQAERSLADAELSAIGFVNMDSGNVLSDGDGNKLSFSLLVNKENPKRVDCAKLIKEQLGVIGIEITVNEVDFNTYNSRISSGSYDLYLAEYPVKNNMDIMPLIDSASGYYHGPVPYYTQQAISGWKSGTEDLSAVITNFNKEMPFIPVLYRQGLAIYTRTLKGKPVSTESDLFYNLPDWSITG